jgi:HlyD family type I secretion membrane fusion protein
MPPLPSLVRPARKDLVLSGGRHDAVGAVISAFESETAAVLIRTSPRHEHIVVYVIVFMIALAIGLMSVTKLDRVVTGTGRIVTTEGSLYVQPLDKAIVRDIRVKVGDVVKRGQTIATLDPTFASADLTQLQQQMASDSALRDRLEAERTGRPYEPTGADPYQVLQVSIFGQRRLEYRSSLDDFDARIRSTEADSARLTQDVELYTKRLALNAEVERMQDTLLKSGYGSKLNAVLAADTREEIQRLLNLSKNQIAQDQHDLDSLKAQRAGYVEKWRDDLITQLVTANNDYDQTKQLLTKAQKLHELINLTAPEDAVVLSINSTSVGSVAGADGTAPLFTLVPLRGPVEAEVEVDATEIGFVKRGDPVAIKLDAYDFLRHGTAKGVVKTISEGSFVIGDDGLPRSPYFKAIVTITEVKLHNVPTDFRLIPGMTVTSDVIVGKRTIMYYIISGAMRTGSEAMREP